MAWIIKAYIPVEPEDPEIYATKEEAEKDIESLSLMQPENIYEAEEIEDKIKSRKEPYLKTPKDPHK